MTVFSKEDKKRVFFYADKDAKYYDIVEELTQPCIDLIHNTMIDLVEYSIQQKTNIGQAHPITVLVVGSGTGAEAFRLLDRFPSIHIVAVDFSPAMNSEFTRKFSQVYPDVPFSSKVTLIEEDFFEGTCEPRALCGHLTGIMCQDGFDVAVAGFFLHHYTAEKKRFFYQRIYQCLNKEGALIHGDLFSFQSRSLSKYAHQFGERWIRKQLTNPDPPLVEKHNQLGIDAARLCQEWVHHWNHSHIYHPAERPYAAVTTTYCSHEEMVLEIGYKEFGFPFRLWEAGILWATK